MRLGPAPISQKMADSDTHRRCPMLTRSESANPEVLKNVSEMSLCLQDRQTHGLFRAAQEEGDCANPG